VPQSRAAWIWVSLRSRMVSASAVTSWAFCGASTSAGACRFEAPAIAPDICFVPPRMAHLWDLRHTPQ
jgi:hypothetical protein